MKRALIFGAATLITLVGCGGSSSGGGGTPVTKRPPSEFDFATETEAFIHNPEGDVAKTLGMEFGQATCEQPFNTEVGEKYKCTAPARDGSIWEFDVEITSTNGFTVQDANPQTATT